MSTLRHLLQEADPLRHEGPPSLETTRNRIRSAPLPAVSTGRPYRAQRRPLVLASLCAILVLIVSWANFDHRFLGIPPVEAQVRFEVRLAESHPVPGLRVAQVEGSGILIYLHPEIVVGNEDIAHAWVVDGSPRFSVHVQVQPSGADRMRQDTSGAPVRS